MAAVVVGCGDEPTRAVDAGQAASPSADSSAGEVSAPTEGILNRAGSAVTGTPRGVFVYGGSERGQPLGGAVLIDPSSGEQQPLPEPPFEAPLAPHSVAASVDGDVFVFGETCQRRVEVDDTTTGCEPSGLAAAIYSLGDGSWRPVAVPEELIADSAPDRPWVVQSRGVTEGGGIVLDLIHEGNRATGQAPFWVYEIASDEWAHLEDPGVVVDDACVAGDDIVVVSSTPGENAVATDVTLTMRSVSGRGAWASGPSLRDVVWSYSPQVGCGDDFAVVYDSEAQVGGVDDLRAPSFLAAVGDGEPLAWQALPDVDQVLPGVEHWTGDRFLLVGLDGAALALDPEALTWTPVAAIQPITPDVDQLVQVGGLLVALDPRSPDPVTVGEVPE